jgi:lipoteichoic acid synthase
MKYFWILATFELLTGIHNYSLAVNNESNIVNSQYINQYAKDSSRYIAHAGGQIDGHHYTNSLEALNENYTNGFRLFELDIIKTSDGHFVAAHDWSMWKKMTGYDQQLPPTKEQFLKQKLMQKYTPIDMNAINQWFSNHSDAILVTDKTKNIMVFANQFIDKNRLIMEIFNWRGLEAASKAKIKSAMPTGYLLKKFDGDVIAFLKSKKITDVAVSRTFIETDLLLLKQLKNAEIRAYAFHIDDEPKYDTDHMICEESEYFYGIYANLWRDDWQPNCSPPSSK